MINVLKYEDLLKIEKFLQENEMDNGNITIVMGIETQERLNRINKDYFYKISPNSAEVPLNNVDNVNIQIGNVTFTYTLKKINENNNK